VGVQRKNVPEYIEPHFEAGDTFTGYQEQSHRTGNTPFRLSLQGYSFTKMGRKMNLSAKYLYSLKRTTLVKYGPPEYGCTGIQVCRDIIGMRPGKNQPAVFD
jgi:hypothetical protein